MDFIDFLIGLSMMHAMPHLILGIWNRRMYSPFGSGRTPNIMYSLVVLLFSLGLFIFKYGVEALTSDGIYLGGITTVIVYALFAPLIYKNLRGQRHRS